MIVVIAIFLLLDYYTELYIIKKILFLRLYYRVRRDKYYYNQMSNFNGGESYLDCPIDYYYYYYFRYSDRAVRIKMYYEIQILN